MRHVQKQSVLLASMVLLCAILVGLWVSTRQALVRCMETNMVLRSDLDSLRIKIEHLEESLDVIRIDLMDSQEDLYSHLYPGVATDVLGNTPDDVVREYVEACQRKDWQAAYECLAMVPITASEYAQEMERAKDETLDFSIESWHVKGEKRATVIVTYRCKFGNGTERTFKYEPWSVIKSDGMWKVRWLPRQ